MQRQVGLLLIKLVWDLTSQTLCFSHSVSFHSAIVDKAEMSMMGLSRCQQDGSALSLGIKASLKRSLSRGSGTFKREQSLRGVSDTPMLCPCIVLSPNESEYLSCITEAVKDILTVTSWGARPLSSYPDVKSMLKDMFGSNLGLSPTKAPASQLTQDKLQALPGLAIEARPHPLPEGLSKPRTLSFNVMQHFIAMDSNASGQVSPDNEDDYNADDPLGILKGNFGGGFQSGAPRVGSFKGGSFRSRSVANPTLPPISPFEVIKRVLGELSLSLTHLGLSDQCIHVGISSLQRELEARCRQQYGNALRHQGLRPYVGHRDELALVGSFDQDNVLESAASFATSLPPDLLHRDIALLRDWAEDMAGPGGQRTSLTSGLLHFNLEALRSTLLPLTCRAFAGYMSKLASALTSSIKDLRQKLDKYIAVLKQRPANLDSFVQFIEETYKHLDDDGDIRLAVTSSKEQLSTLYEILHAAVPHSSIDDTRDSRSLSAGRSKTTPSPPLYLVANEPHQNRQQQEAATMEALSAATDGMIDLGGSLHATNVTARDARPVFQQWKQAQADVIRYQEECVAAREFYESSSSLMASHLKENLVEMEAESFRILSELRTGKSTSTTASTTDAKSELSRLDGSLSSLKSQLERFHAWMKLFGNQPGVKTILQEAESIVLCATSHLKSRSSFWSAASKWERALDQLYSKRCFQKSSNVASQLDNGCSDSEDEKVDYSKMVG